MYADDVRHTYVMRRNLSSILAEENAEAVRRLHDALRAAARHSGLSTSAIAELMGLDDDTVEAALSGRLDLTLSDLQELALAVGAFVGYTVQPGADETLEQHQRIIEDSVLASSLDWEPAPDVDDWRAVEKELATWSGRG